MVLEYFTRAGRSKSIQCHLLAVAPLTIKKAVQAVEEYLAVSGSEHTPRVMPVARTELPTQPSALEISLKTMAEAVTQQTMLLQRVLEKVEKRQFSPKVACASLAAMLAVGAALSIASGLSALLIVAASVVSALIAGGITYTISKPIAPDTELKEVDIQGSAQHGVCKT